MKEEPKVIYSTVNAYGINISECVTSSHSKDEHKEIFEYIERHGGGISTEVENMTIPSIKDESFCCSHEDLSDMMSMYCKGGRAARVIIENMGFGYAKNLFNSFWYITNHPGKDVKSRNLLVIRIDSKYFAVFPEAF